MYAVRMSGADTHTSTQNGEHADDDIPYSSRAAAADHTVFFSLAESEKETNAHSEYTARVH